MRDGGWECLWRPNSASQPGLARFALVDGLARFAPVDGLARFALVGRYGRGM